MSEKESDLTFWRWLPLDPGQPQCYKAILGLLSLLLYNGVVPTEAGKRT